ncbi:MAG: PIN domain-containing protein [Fimbriimonadales bacterium]|nr:PIN domain-containing protein [Fimbriimonadales bacterium]
MRLWRSAPASTCEISMEKALMDTDIWFDILRGVRPRVLEYADAYLAYYGRFTISAMTVAEFTRGLARRQSPALMQKWELQRASLEILPVDERVAEQLTTIIRSQPQKLISALPALPNALRCRLRP